MVTFYVHLEWTHYWINQFTLNSFKLVIFSLWHNSIWFENLNKQQNSLIWNLYGQKNLNIQNYTIYQEIWYNFIYGIFKIFFSTK